MNKYQEAIEKHGFYIATPIGTSMLPLLRERVDTVKLIKPNDLKIGDIVLYERIDGTLVLHRIYEITCINNEKLYTMCGDNQFTLEKGIKENQIIALMDGYYKEEIYIDRNNLKYQKYVKKRMKHRKMRKAFYIIKHPIRTIKNHHQNKERK